MDSRKLVVGIQQTGVGFPQLRVASVWRHLVVSESLLVPMSVDLHVFLKDSLVPSAQDWQRAVHAAGFELTLYENFPVREHSGFLPVVYKNHETGFEFDLSLASTIVADYPIITGHIEGFDLVATFRWGGNIRQGIAAIIASAVLTNLSDGMLFDPQDNTFVNKGDVLKVARQSVQELESHL